MKVRKKSPWKYQFEQKLLLVGKYFFLFDVAAIETIARCEETRWRAVLLK